jgi:hypothetical protein
MIGYGITIQTGGAGQQLISLLFTGASPWVTSIQVISAML